MFIFYMVISVFTGLLMQPRAVWAGVDSGASKPVEVSVWPAWSPTLDFWNEAELIEKSCVVYKCREPYSKMPAYVQAGKIRIGGLSTEEMQILKRVAHDQAQVWGDTILEGDYVAAGHTRLDRVDRVYKKDQLIGYLIKYSEKAWETSNCQYDGVRPSTLLGCLSGRIEESSYVSQDFRTYFYTDMTAAKFISGD